MMLFFYFPRVAAMRSVENHHRQHKKKIFQKIFCEAIVMLRALKHALMAYYECLNELVVVPGKELT